MFKVERQTEVTKITEERKEELTPLQGENAGADNLDEIHKENLQKLKSMSKTDVKEEI